MVSLASGAHPASWLVHLTICVPAVPDSENPSAMMDGISKTVSQTKPVLPLGHYQVLCHRDEKNQPTCNYVIIGGSILEMQLGTLLPVILVTAIIGL